MSCIAPGSAVDSESAVNEKEKELLAYLYNVENKLGESLRNVLQCGLYGGPAR